MKIVKLTAENLKRLRAVEITPDGNTVVIAGRNGQGKTSVLDAIWFALGGGQAMKGTSRPIRDGAEKATVTLDLGDLRVTRTWTEEKTALRVESAEGARYASPQQMLDGLVGRMSFDPLAFAQQDERTQLATLLELVELPFDPAELDARRRGLYEDRTIVGREIKTLEGHLAGLEVPGLNIPDEEISLADVMAELQAAQQQEAARASAERRLTDAKDRVAVLRAQFAAAKAEMDAAQATVDGLPEPVDTTSLTERARDVEETNRRVRVAKEYSTVKRTLDTHRAEYKAKTDAIAELDEEKAAAVAAAKMPIDELAFDEDGVTYRGIPFKQCSAAEQLRVSLAMAMALNPEIRVIRITDGSLLDSDNLRLIEEMAGDRDFQVWIERVDETGRVGVLIEDGQVVDAARERAMREAAEDGFIDNYDPDLDAPGADDYLDEVPS